MRKDVKIARLEKQLSEAKKQIKEAKSEARQAKKELSKEHKKRPSELNSEVWAISSSLCTDWQLFIFEYGHTNRKYPLTLYLYYLKTFQYLARKYFSG